MFGHNVRRAFAAGLAVAVLGVAVPGVVLPGVAVAQEPNKAVLVGPANGATTAGTSPTLQVTFEGRVKGATVPGGPTGERFTVVVLPDTQNYTYAGRQGTITAQAHWAVANRSALNIAFVAQLGPR